MRHAHCPSLLFKLGFTLIAALVILNLAPRRADAQPVVRIKLATMVPAGSTWHELLKQMGEEWSQVSGGKVKLVIFPGGQAGNEGDVVRQLRIGKLQAAALTVIGIHDIETSPQAIATPGLIIDADEWDYVFERMIPKWDERLAAKGYVPLMWGDTGWVFLFSQKPIVKPQDLVGLKVFAYDGDPASLEGWKAAGFQPVVLSSTDILPSLKTSMIDGVTNSPVMVYMARWHETTKYMVNVPWGHLPGATIIKKDVWEKIPEDLRPKIMEIARKYGRKVNEEAMRMQNDAIAQMKKAGLKVVDFDVAGRKMITDYAEKTWPVVRGGVCTPEAFDEVKALRDEFRAKKATGTLNAAQTPTPATAATPTPAPVQPDAATP
ncbi:MAG: TRAP transporter substrate-binding protein DctP [Myxococcales bacterium]|nr:TRAP transporter substrate-binding protein DctP [Myxococcales bacterium]